MKSEKERKKNTFNRIKMFVEKYPSLNNRKINDIVIVAQNLEKVPSKAFKNIKNIITTIDEEKELKNLQVKHIEYKKIEEKINKTFKDRINLIDKKESIQEVRSFLNSLSFICLSRDPKWDIVDTFIDRELNFFERMFPKKYNHALSLTTNFFEIKKYLDTSIYKIENIEFYKTQIKFKKKLKENLPDEINVSTLLHEIKTCIDGDNFNFEDLSDVEYGYNTSENLRNEIQNLSHSIENFKKNFRNENEKIAEILGNIFEGSETNINNFEKEYIFLKKKPLKDLKDKEIDIFKKILTLNFTFEQSLQFIENFSTVKEKFKNDLKSMKDLLNINSFFEDSPENISKKLDQMIEDTSGLENSIKKNIHEQKITHGKMKLFLFLYKLNQEDDKPFTKENIENYLKNILIKYKTGECKLNDIFSIDENLAKIEEEIEDLMKSYVKAKIKQENKSFPDGNGGLVNENTEMNLLNHQFNITRGFRPIRHLLEKARESIQSYKPCFAMSPQAVARYIPKDFKFDLLVVDEASQMTPENALSCFYRCKKIVIVGDDNQLPPTSFFNRIPNEDDECDEDSSSLLGFTRSICNKERLQWHYRSAYPELIAFSNKYIYNNELMLFPSVKKDTSPVKLIDVTENLEDNERIIYQNSTNPLEAEKIKDWILKFVTNEQNHEKSIAIVAMNITQRDLIQDKIDEAYNENENLRKYIDCESKERFIIKNLENMQGDERDIILISLTYGPERIDERVHQRFGPVNGIHGKRRLNVLFTRAREEITTFSSMQENDITLNGNNIDGKKMLQDWIRYSRTGQIESGETNNRTFDSDFEREVAKAIQRNEYKVDLQTGVVGYFIDITVYSKHNDKKFCLGIECDGSRWHSSPSQRRYDKYRQEILESKGWKIYRIWSLDWYNNKQEQTRKLMEVIRNADAIE